MPVDHHSGVGEAGRLQREFPVSYAIFAMARTHRAIAAAKLAEIGLYPNQEIMLIQLAAGDGLSQKMLARTLRVNHATVAKTVARMESVGLVERRVSPVDRRVTLVYLTDAGRAMEERILEVWRDLEGLTTDRLVPNQRSAFLDAVGDILPALDSAYGLDSLP